MDFQWKAEKVGNSLLAIVFPSHFLPPLHAAAITHQSIRLSQM